jgi:heme/copper-type cytochrome/quinol oxidase subunit 4
MRIKVNTLAYIIIGIVYSITPTVCVWLASGQVMPEYTVTPIMVLMAFAFSFVPLVIGFLAGEMYVDDMNESDPLYDISTMRKK